MAEGKGGLGGEGVDGLEMLYLYSKTCDLSMELKRRLETVQRGKNLGQGGKEGTLKPVCVDNEKMRRFITDQTLTTPSRKKVKVTTIPCVVVRFKNGYHEVISGPEILDILKSGSTSPSSSPGTETPSSGKRKNSPPLSG